MSFRSEAAKVRANIAAGNYKEPRDYFSGFAEQIASGIRRQDEAKRQEELEKRREARANARSIAKAQREEDKKVQAQERLVNGYLTVKGYDVTEENRNAVRSVVTNLGITGFADLDDIMKQSSNYVEGTPQADIDQQMNDLAQLRQGDGPFEAESARINNLSSEGRIEFGATRGKDPLEMDLAEVRYELSDQSITADRRALLERRKASLTDPEAYTPTTLYKSDGSEVIARTEAEENTYLAQGFSLVKGAETSDYAKRTLYKDGAQVEVFNKTEEDSYTGQGWSREKPADATEFKQRTVYNADTGEEQQVFSQDELNSAIAAGFSAIKPAPSEKYTKRTLYKDGAEYTVTSQEEESQAVAEGWSAVKPAEEKDFTKQTLYMNGAEVQVTSQADLDKYTEQGYSPVKPANHGQMLTAKQAALQSFMEEEGVSDLQGEDYRNKLAEFERKWEEQSKAVKDKQESYTSANYTADLIKFGSMLLSDDEAERKEATEWFNTTKPIIENSLNVVSGMDDAAKVEALVESGIDRQRALGIVNGTIKVTSDGFGRPVIVDTATNQQSDIGGAESVQDASSRINTENLTPEEQQELETAAKEAEEALKAAGFEGRITELNDVSAAFGPEGFTGKIVNVLGGLVGTTPMENAAEATTVVNALGKVTKFNIISGFAGLRDSVALKAEIEQLLPQTGRLGIGKPEALRRFKGIKALLDQAVILQQATANATNVNTAAVSKANVALNSLRPLAELYGTIVENIEGEQNAPAGVTDSVFKSSGGTTTTDTSLPVVSGPDDPNFKSLKVGEKFSYNGKTYTKKR